MPQNEEPLLLDSATPLNSSIVDYNFRKLHFTIDKSQMKNGDVIIEAPEMDPWTVSTNYFEITDANFTLDEIVNVLWGGDPALLPQDLVQITINNWSGPGTSSVTLDFIEACPTPEELNAELEIPNEQFVVFGTVASTGKLCLCIGYSENS